MPIIIWMNEQDPLNNGVDVLWHSKYNDQLQWGSNKNAKACAHSSRVKYKLVFLNRSATTSFIYIIYKTLDYRK